MSAESLGILCKVYFAFSLLIYGMHNISPYTSHIIFSRILLILSSLLLLCSLSLHVLFPVYDDNVYKMRGDLLKAEPILGNLGKRYDDDYPGNVPC